MRSLYDHCLVLFSLRFFNFCQWIERASGYEERSLLTVAVTEGGR